MQVRYLAVAVMLLGLDPGASAGREPVRADAVLLEVRGAIGPAVSDFIVRGIERAAADGQQAVILEIDTPGGLDTSMREIIRAIIAAPLPVIAYVAPGGARAASAGTYILYACHVAAMAPATNLGAATPIPIGPGAMPGGGGQGRPSDKDKGDDGGAETAAPGDALERKVVNDAVAYLRGLAKLRGRNAEWAEQAVRAGASLTAEDALAKGVIDLMAGSVEDLLGKLDGRRVVVDGNETTLHTAGWEVVAIEPDWRSELLAVLTNPNVAYMLMLLGVYGLLFELYSPGAIVPGVVGTIALLLALYAFHVLPVNYAGVALILVGIALMVAELFTPTLGVLGVGGAVSFVAGSVILMDTDVEAFTLSLPLVVTVGAAAAILLTATIGLAVRQRKRPVVTGREEMIGAPAQALESFDEMGRVLAHGEVWNARSARPVIEGERLEVKSVEGLTLEVVPGKEEE